MTITHNYGEINAVFNGVRTTINVSQSVLAIVTYVLLSLGLYTIAKKRGVHNAWFAWVPLLRAWLIGCISDHYRYVARNEVKRKRVALLVLPIVTAVLVVFVIASGVVLFGFTLSSRFQGEVLAQMDGFGGAVAAFAISGIAAVIVGIVGWILTITCYYDIFLSCSPSNAVVFLVLSIIIPVTTPFFVFFTRNKADGMPAAFNQPNDEEHWTPSDEM